MALGAALHRWGIPAHRLEARLSEVARRMGLEAQFFSTPTSLMAGFGPMAAQQVRLSRVEPGSVDMSKLLELDEVSEAVARGQLAPGDAMARVRQIDERPAFYRGPLAVLGFGLAAAAAAQFFDGGAVEIAAAGGAGMVAGALSILMPRVPRSERLFELMAAFFVTLWVAVLQALGVQTAPLLVILAGLIVLVPGLTLTVAVSELATKNLVSGSARLTSSGLSLLQIAVGVALAQKLGLQLFGPLVEHVPTRLPWPSELATMVAMSVALLLLFQAPLSLLPGFALVTTVAFVGTRFASAYISAQLGASMGALCVALIGNAYARWRNRPAVVLIVPGLLVLVPGSLGFRSVSSLMAKDATMGVETAFNMGVVAVSIVAGLLVANVVLPPGMGERASSSL